jgi:CBS domain-containing protein
VISDYSADILASTLVGRFASRQVVSLRWSQTLGEVRAWVGSAVAGSTHNGFPVLDEQNRLVGVVTRKDIDRGGVAPDIRIRELLRRPPVVIREENTIREAINLMVREGVGRLPVVRGRRGDEVAGILTRSDLLAAYGSRLQESQQRERTLKVGSALLRQAGVEE